jgi:hypothetical protein
MFIQETKSGFTTFDNNVVCISVAGIFVLFKRITGKYVFRRLFSTKHFKRCIPIIHHQSSRRSLVDVFTAKYFL